MGVVGTIGIQTRGRVMTAEIRKLEAVITKLQVLITEVEPQYREGLVSELEKVRHWKERAEAEVEAEEVGIDWNAEPEAEGEELELVGMDEGEVGIDWSNAELDFE